jgi:acetyl esterase/lipase
MESVIARVRALGKEFTPEQIAATRAVFAPLVARPADVGALVERDLSYGPDARQRLDVFQPAEPGAPRPVVVFVHGGGFVMGDKGDAGAPFFNNFGAWAVRAGFVGVTMTYRLAPAHLWPSGPVDVEAAVQWLATNIHQYGGFAGGIVLVGHSAGAAHVAGYLARHGSVAGSPVRVAGAAMISGIYQLEGNAFIQSHDVYFGADAVRRAAMSTTQVLATLPLPCLYSVSELDPLQYQLQAAELVAACASAAGRYPRLAWLEGHNHVSSVLQLSSPGDSLGETLARFVLDCTAVQS